MGGGWNRERKIERDTRGVAEGGEEGRSLWGGKYVEKGGEYVHHVIVLVMYLPPSRHKGTGEVHGQNAAVSCCTLGWSDFKLYDFRKWTQCCQTGFVFMSVIPKMANLAVPSFYFKNIFKKENLKLKLLKHFFKILKLFLTWTKEKIKFLLILAVKNQRRYSSLVQDLKTFQK